MYGGDFVGETEFKADLGHPASLTIWPAVELTAKGVEPREMASLRAALFEAFDALAHGTGSPWIITRSGLILTPAALAALMPLAHRFRPPEA